MIDANAVVPRLMPARMVNEYVYCPRLFYLEWSDKQWEPSDDTEVGRWTHRDVDTRHGVLPPPGETAPRTVRSVALSDAGWGLTALVDRVDDIDGTTSPVDYKKGRPAPDGRAWPADRAQSLAQCALLEAAGYRVREGVLSYAETHERVTVAWGEAAAAELRMLLDEARAVAEAVRPPLPLVDSPRCTRCSLAGLCLPDEINMLLTRSQAVGRRVLPRAPDSHPVYVSEPGAMVSVRSARLVVTAKGEQLADVRLLDVQSLCVFGNVQVSTQALTKLWAAGAPVLYMSHGGWLNGWSQPPPMKNVELRRRQVIAHATGVRFAAQMISGKVRDQRTMLRRLVRGETPTDVLDTMALLARSAASAQSVGELLGIEGAAARLYFEHLPRVFGPDVVGVGDFTANGREKRPPLDPINCVLSYTYALLTKDLVVACLAVGLDPYLGVLHRPRFGRPSLALDLMEEFRPLVADSVAIGLFNNGELAGGDFIRRGVGVALTQEGRRKVIRAYERRVASEMKHPTYGYRVSYRRTFEVQARVLAAAMIGELADYSPVVTR